MNPAGPGGTGPRPTEGRPPRAPGLAPNPPLSRPQSVRARRGVSGGTKASLWRPSPSHNRALCGPHPLGLPCWTKGAPGPRPGARARRRGRPSPRSLSRAREPPEVVGGREGVGGRRVRGGEPDGLGVPNPLPTRPPSARCGISCSPARLQRRAFRGRLGGPGAAGGGTLEAGPREETWSGPGLPPPSPLGDPPGPGPRASRAPPARCQLQPAAAPRPSPPQPLGPFHLP